MSIPMSNHPSPEQHSEQIEELELDDPDDIDPDLLARLQRRHAT